MLGTFPHAFERHRWQPVWALKGVRDVRSYLRRKVMCRRPYPGPRCSLRRALGAAFCRNALFKPGQVPSDDARCLRSPQVHRPRRASHSHQRPACGASGREAASSAWAQRCAEVPELAVEIWASDLAKWAGRPAVQFLCQQTRGRAAKKRPQQP